MSNRIDFRWWIAGLYISDVVQFIFLFYVGANSIVLCFRANDDSPLRLFNPISFPAFTIKLKAGSYSSFDDAVEDGFTG
jgi:hypothetical protein